MDKLGLPSVDKPWLKYYKNEASFETDCSIFDFVLRNNEEHLDDIIFEYLGSRITYKVFFNKIAEAEKKLRGLGIGKGEYVGICSVTTPEVVYCFYALNKIGAIVNFIEPRNNAARIHDYIKESNMQYIMYISACRNKIREAVNGLNKKTLIEFTPTLSAAWYVKLFSNLKRKGNLEGILLWERCQCSEITQEEPIIVKGEDVAAIVYTSGTTGIPKGACLTNEGLNKIAVGIYEVQAIGRERQDRILMIMPPFIAYGLCSIHTSVWMGKKAIVIPNFKPENFTKLVYKYKPNHIVGVPSFFEQLISKDVRKLTFVKSMIAGGDKMNVDSERLINQHFADAHIPVRMCKGYGMTEIGSGAICTTPDCNKLGSCGIPLPFNNVKIISPKDGHELTYGETGEIYINAPTRMKGYLNRDQETKKVFTYDQDGEAWVKTGDIGYIDEDGAVFILDRIKRMIVRPDGHNVFPSVIENVICKSEQVLQCCVVGKEDNQMKNGKWPIAYVVLNKGTDVQSCLNDIESIQERELPERDRAVEVHVISEIPLTDVGKVDYRKLELFTKEE